MMPLFLHVVGIQLVGAHPSSYPMDTRGSFLGVKAAGVWSWPHLKLVPRSKNEWRYTSTLPIRLHGVLLS